MFISSTNSADFPKVIARDAALPLSAKAAYCGVSLRSELIYEHERSGG